MNKHSALTITAAVAIALAGAGFAVAQTTTPRSGTGGTMAPDSKMPDTTTTPAKQITAATARTQIEASGYSKVKGLTRQSDGTWRARATKNDQEVAVIVDATGKVTQMQQ